LGVLAAGVTVIAAGTLIALLGAGERAGAVAPCVSHSNTPDETDFLALLQTWRNDHIAGSLPLTLSAPLNAAAAGYAQFLAQSPGSGGHYADGSDWVVRANQCGFVSSASGTAGGEGLAVVEGGSTVSVSPQGALDIMSAHGGSGISIPSNVGLPVKCVGVAKMTASSGRKVAWVTLLFAVSASCPQAVSNGSGSTPSATPTTPFSPTAAATRTATPGPTATPTRPPDPRPFKAVVVQVANDAAVSPLATGPAPTPVVPQLATPTPFASSACHGTSATITALDKLGEHVTVSGSGDMTGWYLLSENGNQRFDFPFGFALNGAVVIDSGRPPFPPSSQNLWWITSTVWNNTADDDALLYDCVGVLAMRFDDGM
jgi:hypothetical protein